jgi:hypothetical protein
MAEIFVIRDGEGQYMWAENCPQCGNDEQFLGVESSVAGIFFVKCLNCCQTVGLCTIRGSEIVYLTWGSEDDVLKAWDEGQLKIRVVPEVSK